MMRINTMRGTGIHNGIGRNADAAVRGVYIIYGNEADDGCYE